MIDRQALVRRHNPVVTGFDKFASLSVGNGNYAFTVDATGLQTFPAEYADGGVPLGHLSNRIWHTFPNPQQYRMADFPLTYYETFNGRRVGFPYSPRSAPRTDEYHWLQSNPHRLHLAQVGFRLLLPDGRQAESGDLTDMRQTLDLWTGVIASRFAVGARASAVETCCHPQQDTIAVRVASELIAAGALQIAFRFPYGSGDFAGGPVWDKHEAHATEIAGQSSGFIRLRRIADGERHEVSIAWSAGSLVRDSADPHLFLLTPDPQADGRALELAFRCSPEGEDGVPPGFAEVREASRAHWESFWRSGAALELAGSADPRAGELERRVVLSQYLTAIQSSGMLPPQESGLTHNSWYGKFHLEMHWWHAVHFALWGRPELLENSMSWYNHILPQARALAAGQGYDGARWPKCVGPDGVNGPCYIEPFLIWQQPHPIYYAELLHRCGGGEAALERYRNIVFESASFMASFAEWDEAGQRFVLGPPVAPAQEIYDHAVTRNPAFELSYWAFGLTVANEWRVRLGLPKEERWERVVRQLSPLPVSGGLYAAAETSPDTFRDGSGLMIDHPTMLAPLGMLPGLMVDEDMMRRTLHEVIGRWNWDHTWGWDYPMTAMTAARLGEGRLAVDALLMERGKNTYLPNGHNWQRSDLSVYLPGNGGLLAAVAMMAAGWEGGPDGSAPGFPQDGSWTVRCEGFAKML